MTDIVITGLGCRLHDLHHGTPLPRTRTADPRRRLFLDVIRTAPDDAGPRWARAPGTVGRDFDPGGPGLAVGSARPGPPVALDRAVARLSRCGCLIGVLVRPLADALATGDPVHALIRRIGSTGPGPVAATAGFLETHEGLALCCFDAGWVHSGHSLSAADIDIAGPRRADGPLPFPYSCAPRRAAVGGFGYGGPDGRVPAEDRAAPVPAPVPSIPSSGVPSFGGSPERGGAAGPQLVLLSAGDPGLLDEHIGDVLDALDTADRAPLAAVAHTLGSRRPLRARLAIVADDTEEFVRRLRRARRQLTDDGERGDLGEGAFAADAPVPVERRRLAFLFPGREGGRPDLPRRFYERFPGFRATVDGLAASAHQDSGPDLGDPQLGAVQIAATRLLADLGVRPDLVLGHGVGEFAAAAAAGALTAEDTVRLLVHRGAGLREAGSGLHGGMLAVQTDKETCRRLLTGINDVWLACFNQPRQVVVSGTPHGLAAVRQACAGAGVVTAALDLSHAFHSPRLAAADARMRAALSDHPVSRPVLPFVSSVSAALCADPERLRALWARHASAPVRFDDAVRTAHDRGARVFVQVTGGSALLTAVRRTLVDRGDVRVVPVTGAAADDGRSLVIALARLAVLGVPVDPRALVPQGERRPLDLPVAGLATRPCHGVPHRRPGRTDAGAASRRPATPEESAMYESPHHPMDELIRLVQRQTELLARLGEVGYAAGDTAVVGGRELLSFSRYDYLGLATHPLVAGAAREATERRATSVPAGRPLHPELESALADLLGCEAASTLADGHATPVTAIGGLVGPEDLVVHDALAHEGILRGCRLSGATRRPFAHNDAAALDALLTRVRGQYRRALVVVEGVHSMDGDIADLPALVEVKQRHGALLMVDEAHSIGTIGRTGRGVGEYFDVDRTAVDLWSGTLSKALAGYGGYVAGSRSVVEALRGAAPGFVHGSGTTAAGTAAALSALGVLRAEPERVARLADNAALFVHLAREAGVDTAGSRHTPVVPCVVGDALKTLRLAEALFRQGISVNPVLRPAVPGEPARLRFLITSDHTPGRIRRAVAVLARELLLLDTAPAA
ncbi:aminotransferase class I/II-fold pyridoxal phosphate-dependent enzyme [Streptomyces sp. NPDC097617]|uniref:aminotransferase class I/II-fold pyridoxal phosphate-dependent enzyme n=1 Tax=Streptomyces sp. NPDC097617 TaxID=3366091 RepID=UPI00382B26DB